MHLKDVHAHQINLDSSLLARDGLQYSYDIFTMLCGIRNIVTTSWRYCRISCANMDESAVFSELQETFYKTYHSHQIETCPAYYGKSPVSSRPTIIGLGQRKRSDSCLSRLYICKNCNSKNDRDDSSPE
ncbi:hypothetical protein AVEN_121274-1 [Araneus ventricosus]|uniref:Uncharacterized protein n=1 Tax=Araneus ventricosus TaxID=182803 RepID=A0A4Y2NC09_ARAVE|nr:hypothetical protein AVEN_121274-1 [Araneus ventricosus]